LSVSLYYCIVYSAIQPLKAASVLNKISSVQGREKTEGGRERMDPAILVGATGCRD